jgi:hypothetical protein
MRITAINYVQNACLVELNKIVNGMVECGWQPFGPVSVHVWTTSSVQYPVIYIQTMVAVEEKLATDGQVPKFMTL